MALTARIANKASLLVETLAQPGNMAELEKAVDVLVEAGRHRRLVVACGNGGSASTAEQLVTELIGRFRYARDPLPALTLTAASPFTALANDYGYDRVFARQVDALLHPGDVWVGYSTSGNSPNVIEAAKAARAAGATTIGFSGSGGKLKDEVDIALAVPTTDLTTVEELHLILTHLVCEEVEERLFAATGRRIR